MDVIFIKKNLIYDFYFSTEEYNLYREYEFEFLFIY